MKIAFDLDGTCWKHREFFAVMINGFNSMYVNE